MKAYKSAAVKAGKMVQLGTYLNPLPPTEIPDGTILTVNGEVIYAVGDSLYVFAVNSPTLLTSFGEPIKSTDNKFITI